MHRKGVVCSDCHDPHTGKTKAPGNALCTSCHNATGAAARPHIDTSGLKRAAYDAPRTHHHAQADRMRRMPCAEAHLHGGRPAPRPRVPHPAPRSLPATARPTPAMCATRTGTQVGGGRGREVVRPQRRAEAHYGQAFAAARDGRPGAAAALQRWPRTARSRHRPRGGDRVARRLSQPQCARARHAALADDDGMVARRRACGGGARPGDRRCAKSWRLSDPLRAVRIEAARSAGACDSRLPADRRQAWDRRAGARSGARENADRPQSWLGLAQMAVARGTHRRRARIAAGLKLEPSYVPAVANLADLIRQTGRDRKVKRCCGRRSANAERGGVAGGIGTVAGPPEAQAGSVAVLARAQALPSATSRTSYLYAVCWPMPAGAEAIAVLERASRKRGDRDVLLALASYRRDAGRPTGARPRSTGWQRSIPAILRSAPPHPPQEREMPNADKFTGAIACVAACLSAA